MFEKQRHELYLILGAFLFAVNGIPAKLVLGSALDSLRLTQIRTLGGFLILLIWLLIRDPASLRVSKKEIPLLIAFGLIGFAGVNTFYFLSIHRLKVSIALLIEFTSPIWIALYLRYVRKVQVSYLMWWGLGISLAGLALLAQVWQGMTLDTAGVIFAFIDALCMCIYFLLGEKLTKTHPTAVMLVWGMGISSIFFAIIQPIWSFPFENHLIHSPAVLRSFSNKVVGLPEPGESIKSIPTTTIFSTPLLMNPLAGLGGYAIAELTVLVAL